jgi:hypothetical protein
MPVNLEISALRHRDELLDAFKAAYNHINARDGGISRASLNDSLVGFVMALNEIDDDTDAKWFRDGLVAYTQSVRANRKSSDIAAEKEGKESNPFTYDSMLYGAILFLREMTLIKS